jgi:hypothetical protein
LDLLSVSQAQCSIVSVSQFIPDQIAIDVSQFLEDLDGQEVTVLSPFDDLRRAGMCRDGFRRPNRESA